MRADPGSPGRRRFQLLLVTAVVLASTACGNPLDSGPVTEEDQRNSYEGVTSLVVDHEARSVEIFGGSQLTVYRKVRSSGGRRPSDRVLQDGNALSVGADCPSVMGASICEVDYRITVPPEVDVTVRAQANAVRISDLQSNVNVSTDSGRIDISGVSGDAHTSTNAGETVIRLNEPTVVQSSSDSGDITVAFDAPPGELVASSASGNITVTVPSGSGPYQAVARTTSGQSVITVPQAQSGIPLTLTTDNGSITVTTTS